LRLLGQVQKDENDGLAKGRAWILSHGTATAAPQWAKILLSVVNLFSFLKLIGKARLFERKHCKFKLWTLLGTVTTLLCDQP